MNTRGLQLIKLNHLLLYRCSILTREMAYVSQDIAGTCQTSAACGTFADMTIEASHQIDDTRGRNTHRRQFQTSVSQQKFCYSTIHGLAACVVAIRFLEQSTKTAFVWVLLADPIRAGSGVSTATLPSMLVCQWICPAGRHLQL